MAKYNKIPLVGNYIFNDKKFYFSTFQEFVEKFNIFNNDIANQENLNKGVDQIKKELNMIFGLFAILTDKEAPRWQPNIVYNEGEIVSFIEKENPSLEDVINSYYIAIYSEDDNLSKNPEISASLNKYWMKITAEMLFPRVNGRVWAKYHPDFDWTITEPLDLVNLKKLQELVTNLKTEILELLEGNYLTNDYRKNLNITEDTHIPNKLYVDTEVSKVSAKAAELARNLISNYVRIDENRKLIAGENGIAAVLTPDNGIYPGKNNVSTLGTQNQVYKAVYATDFMGTALKARYADLAEYYDFDINAKSGDVIGINEDGFALFDYIKGHKLIGVVTTNPAVVLNSDSQGTCIALKGQTPVKVLGKVKLGDYIIAHKDGYGIVGSDTDKRIGIALEGSNDENIKLINVKIQ